MFRFRLRTLFFFITLIALALGWLAWQRRVVNQRLELLDTLFQQGASYVTVTNVEGNNTWGVIANQGYRNRFQIATSLANHLTRGLEPPEPRSLRGWFGDVTISRIWTGGGTAAEIVELARRLAPEAVVENLPVPPQFNLPGKPPIQNAGSAGRISAQNLPAVLAKPDYFSPRPVDSKN